MNTLKAAFFVKNLPAWERALRIAVALAGALLALATLAAPWSWLAASAAASFGITGVVGFCPACALAGRRLHKQV